MMGSSTIPGSTCALVAVNLGLTLTSWNTVSGAKYGNRVMRRTSGYWRKAVPRTKGRPRRLRSQRLPHHRQHLVLGGVYHRLDHRQVAPGAVPQQGRPQVDALVALLVAALVAGVAVYRARGVVHHPHPVVAAAL